MMLQAKTLVSTRWGIGVIPFLAIGWMCVSGLFLQAANTPKVVIEEATWESVQTQLAKHRGKVVVIDLWSTSCDPCLKEFPHLVALQKKHGEKVVCLSFNLDYAGIRSKPVEYYRPRVLEFLEKHPGGVQHFMSQQAADDVFEAIELDSIPAVYVYDTNGKLAQRFDGRYKSPHPKPKSAEDDEESVFDYTHDIEPLVVRLISMQK